MADGHGFSLSDGKWVLWALMMWALWATDEVGLSSDEVGALNVKHHICYYVGRVYDG